MARGSAAHEHDSAVDIGQGGKVEAGQARAVLDLQAAPASPDWRTDGLRIPAEPQLSLLRARGLMPYKWQLSGPPIYLPLSVRTLQRALPARKYLAEATAPSRRVGRACRSALTPCGNLRSHPPNALLEQP